MVEKLHILTLYVERCNVQFVMSSNPRHLILNLLLSNGGEALTAREAVASCALFGVLQNNTRVALARLQAAGLIESAGRSSYRLGAMAAQLAADVTTWRNAEQRVRDWKGDWVAVHVGGLGRCDRVALRSRDRAFGMLGLGEFERGLYLRPNNLVGGVAAARERLVTLGLELDAIVFVAKDFDSAREQRARALWDGGTLTGRYRETKRSLDNWLDQSETLDLDTAARESFVLGNDAIRQLVFDPLLPAPFVDVEARRALVDAVVRFDAAGHAIWHRFLATVRSQHPNQRVRPALDASLEVIQ
jgi:phenylacetic acid degradation operon negative regulatory protein